MCLDYKCNFPVRQKFAYKLFNILDNDKIFSAYKGDRAKQYKANTWLTAESVVIPMKQRGTYYNSGFHMYTNRIDAWKHNPSFFHVLKVEFDDIITRGYQSEVKVIVARKMKIIWK